MKQSTNWTLVCPPSPVKEIEAARARVLDLRGRIAGQRDAIEQAKRDVAAAEQGDRARMARELAEGHDPVSDMKAVERARE